MYVFRYTTEAIYSHLLISQCILQGILSGKYHCTIDLLFDWFGISCVKTDNFCFYLQNRQIQTSQTGGQWYSDTSRLIFPGILFHSRTKKVSILGFWKWVSLQWKRLQVRTVKGLLNLTLTSVVRIITIVRLFTLHTYPRRHDIWNNDTLNNDIVPLSRMYFIVIRIVLWMLDVILLNAQSGIMLGGIMLCLC